MFNHSDTVPVCETDRETDRWTDILLQHIQQSGG